MDGMSDMSGNTNNMDSMIEMESSGGGSFCGGMSGMSGMSMGGGTTMYMEGFRFTLASDSDTGCLNLFFPSWTLDTKGKFVGAMFGIFFLGVLVEGISAFRLRQHKRMKPSALRKITVMSLHGIQALFGYILMLATMTFSAELLLCTVFGLAAGYGIFFDDSIATHVTTNPCCGFMEDEAVEQGKDDNENGTIRAKTATISESNGDRAGECLCPCVFPDEDESTPDPARTGGCCSNNNQPLLSQEKGCCANKNLSLNEVEGLA